MNVSSSDWGLLQDVVSGQTDAFAVIYRPNHHPKQLEIVEGPVTEWPSIGDIPIGSGELRPGRTVILLPYRQMAERGFDVPEDEAHLLTIESRQEQTVDVDYFHALTDSLEPATIERGGYVPDDQEYERLVQAVIDEEIEKGEGANFVLKRSFRGTSPNWGLEAACKMFSLLLESEVSTYWTFLVVTDRFSLIGASPERHITYKDQTVSMMPISGTYRYPRGGPNNEGLRAFIDSQKEASELCMVLDEELKIMAQLCPAGGRISGPYLKRMSSLAHTVYEVSGQSTADWRTVLDRSMFAPTVVGGPLRNAASIVKRYEPGGRRYYAGAIALVDEDAAGVIELDSAITIRTAEISHDGEFRLDVGSTIVKDSHPPSEQLETRAKAEGLLSAMRVPASLDGEMAAALAGRNSALASMWLDHSRHENRVEAPSGARALIVDAEDSFTSMLACLLDSLGVKTSVCSWDEVTGLDDWDLICLGPGPGSPVTPDGGRISSMRSLVERLLRDDRRFIAVCLSHQLLAHVLGLRLERYATPQQGVQRSVEVMGRSVKVGFYNSYSAYAPSDTFMSPFGEVSVHRDAATGEAHALTGKRFASFQFHPESVLSVDGRDVMAMAVEQVCRAA